ncbi:hypothetical protein PV318_00040 [Streptomyces sp. ME02-6991-2B]|nr:hypothetical protein [Streptomyces sp. ME02-6991-2B]
MDYHFVMQQAVERLWSGRRQVPAGLESLEVFARLDLALAEAAPEAVSIQNTAGPVTFVRITSIGRLITLLEREGAFAEALELAHRMGRFEQLEDVAARLRDKTAALETEQWGKGAV